MINPNGADTLYHTTTPDDGVIRLMQWPEGYELWYHGSCAWRSWKEIVPPVPVPVGVAKWLNNPALALEV